MKIFKKSLAVILTVIMVLTTFSVAMPVFAAGNLFAKDTDEYYVQEEITSKIVSEVTELREENAKHFICEDGSYIVSTYNDPIHYKEDGQWKEIDNNLKLSSDVKSSMRKAVYTTEAGIVDVKIPQSFSAGEKVSATNKGYTISFGANHDKIIYAQKPTAVVKDVEDLASSKLTDKTVVARASATSEVSSSADNEIAAFNSEAMTVKNQAGAVVYENVFGNDDLEYIVTTNTIKENIVVNEKQDKYIYSFDMDFGELVPVVNEDNSIRVINPEKPEEIIFYIAAPYMYDTNEIESTAIEMSLVEEDGIYVMTLHADAEWINATDRRFPVIIDPTVYLSFDDVFVMDGLLNKNTTKINDELRVGRNLTNLTRTYMKFELPTNIPTGSYIYGAILELTQDNYYQAPLANDVSIRAYDLYNVNSWSPNNVTWNNQPISNSNNGYNNTNAVFLSYITAESNRPTYQFAITEAARRWLNGGVNNGIMLASSDESSKTQVDLCSSRASDSSKYPTMFINYREPGLNISTWETDSQASEKSFEIITGRDWTAYTDSDWISLSATSGTAGSGFGTSKIIVTENTSVEDRTGTVTVKVGNTVIGTIVVTQYGADPYITINPATLNFAVGSSAQTVNISSNTTWSFGALPDWITVTPSAGSKNSTVEIRVADNHSTAAREYTATVTADDVTQTVNVHQAYDNVPPITPDFYEENGLVYIVPHNLTENSSPETVQYSLDGTNWFDYTEPLDVVRTYGATVYARVIDQAGNASVVAELTLENNLGEYTASYSDIAFGDGLFPVGFDRTYTSTNGWFFTFDANVAEEDENTYVFTDFYGEKQYFIDSGDGVFESANGEELTVTVSGETVSGYSLNYGDMAVEFNANGKLSKIITDYTTTEYTWNTNGTLTITGGVTVTFTDGNPTKINITRDADNIKEVDYVWTGDNLTKFIDASEAEHNYAYAGGKMTTNDTETITYADGRVRLIQQQNGAYVKYIYNANDVTVKDSKGIVDTLYYSDGIEVTNSIVSYTDKAEYKPDDIADFLTESTIDTVIEEAYVIDAYGKKVEKTEPTYTYDDNGNVLTKVYSRTVNGESVITQKYVYTYDENGKMLTEKYYEADGNNNLLISYEYLYNANGKIVTETYYKSEEQEDGTVVSVADEKYENHYDRNGYLVTEIHYEVKIREDGSIINQFIDQYAYTYDENYKLLTERYFDIEQNIIYLSYEYTYDTNGNTVSEVYYTFDSDSNEGKPDEKYVYTYFEDNKLNTETYYKANGTADFFITSQNTYDTDSNIVSEVYYVQKEQDGAIVDVITERITREYENNRLVSEISEKRDNDTLVNHEKTCYDYDDKGTITSQNDYQWLYDTWCRVYGESYTYNGYGNITGKVATTYTNTENADTGVIEAPSYADTTDYLYDAWNQQIKETTNADQDDEIVSEATFDVLGRTTSVSDDGTTTAYTYDDRGNVLTVTEDEEVTSYTYSNNGNLVSITNPDSTVAGYSYDTFGNLIGHNFNGYAFTYNTLASILTASSESGQLVNYTYSDTVAQEVLTSNFGNGQSIVYEYNDDGEITAIKLGEETKYGYAYLEITDEYGDVTEEWTELTDYVSGLKKIFEENKTTVNDLNGNFIYSVEDVSDDYDGKKITVGTDVYTLVTEENKDTFKTNGTTDFEKTYTYVDNDLTKVETAGLTTSFEYNADKFISVLENTLNDVSKAYGYTYDDNGNITTETVTTKDSDGNIVATETVTYTYDDKEQLTSAETSTTRWNYSYDNRGNILSKSETDLNSNATVTDTYVYDETWKDKLISYNGQLITYDAAGNPTSYLGNTLTWTMGRQLATFGDISYTYNEDGIRTSKTVNNVTTTYYLDGTNIIEQRTGDTVLHFHYDSSDEIIGFAYGENDYFYVKNSMGDIIGITDINGNLVASYTYDAWGKVTSVTGSNTEIGNLNPLRYRSYYYDSDIQMYYLQSRYYDPEIGRFINCDDVNYIGITELELSYNPFAYCENNPVNGWDPSGYALYRLSKQDFKTDKFGIKILKHYLIGKGKTLTIKNDNEWSKYLAESKMCGCNNHKKYEVTQTLRQYIGRLLINKKSELPKKPIEKYTFKVEAAITNGEGIIGRNYLHGTNKKKGGLKISVQLIKVNGQEAYSVTTTWNDYIDPNFNYSSDSYKYAIATKIPFLKPKNYTIRITWTNNYPKFSLKG